MKSEKKPHMMELPRMYDPRGSLTFVEENRHVAFDIKRVYWIYDVPGGESRGAHSHFETELLIVAAGGSFEVKTFDGKEWESFMLTKPFEGLYVPPGYWHTLGNFSSGSVALVMASTLYTEDDYERDFEKYLEWARKEGEA